MLEAMFEMEERVVAAQAEAAQQVEVAADVLEIQAQEAQHALELGLDLQPSSCAYSCSV